MTKEENASLGSHLHLVQFPVQVPGDFLLLAEGSAQQTLHLSGGVELRIQTAVGK